MKKEKHSLLFMTDTWWNKIYKEATLNSSLKMVFCFDKPEILMVFL